MLSQEWDANNSVYLLSELPTVELSREGRYGGVLLFMIVVSRRGGIQYAFYFDVACDLRANRGLGGGKWELRRKIAETEMPSA